MPPKVPWIFRHLRLGQSVRQCLPGRGGRKPSQPGSGPAWMRQSRMRASWAVNRDVECLRWIERNWRGLTISGSIALAAERGAIEAEMRATRREIIHGN